MRVESPFLSKVVLNVFWAGKVKRHLSNREVNCKNLWGKWFTLTLPCNTQMANFWSWNYSQTLGSTTGCSPINDCHKSRLTWYLYTHAWNENTGTFPWYHWLPYAEVTCSRPIGLLSTSSKDCLVYKVLLLSTLQKHQRILYFTC